MILAGSVGTAMALPTANALKQAGNHVIFIEGARNKEMVVFEDEVRAASNETYIMTDDGSYGEQGLVTKKLNELIAAGRKIDFVLAVGPVPMMRAVAQITAPLGIKTMVSLNSIMVDGTGMCGGCRVLLGNKSKFACVDGPEFDASQVNFEVLMQRNAMYRDKECESLKRFEEHKEEELAQMRAESPQERNRRVARELMREERRTMPDEDTASVNLFPERTDEDSARAHAGAGRRRCAPQLRGSEPGPDARPTR